MKRLKYLFVIALILGGAYLFTPEAEIKKSRKESVAYLAEEAGYPPAVCNFMVGTKVGRKLCYIGLKKEMKSYLRQAKKEIRKATK